MKRVIPVPGRGNFHPWRRFGGIIFWCAALSLICGCATAPIPGASRDLVGFLDPGRTTREEVVLKLGQPSGAFEQERIITYRLGQDDKQGYFIVSQKATMPWQSVRYSLVLVFDEKGVLLRKNMVDVN
jgi:hypothetical protein